jgi:hypothetical protein
MPIHDWSRVADGTFHDFHLGWIAELRKALNARVLPSGYYARAEQITEGARQRSIIIRHASGHRVVAMIEIVSRGNKASEYAFSTMVNKAVAALRQGVHLLLVDLHAPTPRDPNGLHAAIWEAIRAGQFQPPADRPLTLASYDAGPVKVAYVEAVRPGDVLPAMPLVLESPEYHIAVPLEDTYMAAWEGMPSLDHEALDPPGAQE